MPLSFFLFKIRRMLPILSLNCFCFTISCKKENTRVFECLILKQSVGEEFQW